MLEKGEKTHEKRCYGGYWCGAPKKQEIETKVPEVVSPWPTADFVEKQGLKMLKYDVYAVEIDEWKALAAAQKRHRAALLELNDQVDQMIKKQRTN